MMFDGAAVVTALQAATDPLLAASDRDTQPEAAAVPPSSVALPTAWRAGQPDLSGGRREAVFIDAGLPDIEGLVNGASPGAEVWLISRDADGIAQLAAWAAGREGYDAIHLVGYGAPGAQSLGLTALDATAIQARETEMRTLGQALTATGDILLYGCNITATDAGLDMIGRLAQATGADVAASSDITGAASSLGDWQLESSIGLIDASVMQPTGWEGSLHTNSVGFNIVNSGGTLTLYFFYGSWHSGAVPAEGALSLYTLQSGGNKDNYADYTVEAYGVGGAIGDQTYAFVSPTTGSTETVGGITLSYENGSTVYDNAKIDAAGFVRGTTYYWADNSNLYSSNTQVSLGVYNHQWAQISNIQPGTYTAYYDTNPASPTTAAASLSANWAPQTAIRQMIFTITASGQVVLGASTPVTKSGTEDALVSFTNSDFTSNFSGTLGDIKIKSLPTQGALFIDGDSDGVIDASESVIVDQVLNATERGQLKLQPTANFNGTTTFQWLAQNSGGSWATSNSDASITFSAANDAPVASGSATLAAINENTQLPNGATISSLFSSNFSDSTDQVSGGSSANTLAGAVIVANTADAATQGVWQYSTDTSTGTWHDVDTVSTSSGLVLASTASLRFKPVAGYSGTPAGLTAHLIESSYAGSYTSGTTRQTLDTTVAANTGGATRVSSGTASLGTTVTALDDPATLTLGADPGGSYAENATDKFIAPNLTLSDSDTFSLTTAKVMVSGNFVSAQDRLALTANAATMGNISGSYDTSSGVLTLTSSGGTATMAQWQEALRNVRYSNTSDHPDTSARTIEIVLGNAVMLDIGGTKHFYEYVAASGINWNDAYSAASSRTLLGMTGYLATVSSAAENSFIKDKLRGNAWLGASDATADWRVNGKTFSTSEGVWKWVSGPEAGQHFWADDTNAGNSIEFYQGTAVGGLYNAWSSGEPNNWGGTEDVAHFYSSDGSWNDFAANNSSISGYVVEYNLASAGTPAFTASTTITPGRANDAPTLSDTTDPSATSELANASAQDIAAITGTFSVTDPDVGDTLTASIVGSPVVRLNGSVITTGFPAALTASGAFALSPATRTSAGTATTFTWTYNPAAANLDFLKAGDSLTITYEVKVGDGQVDSGTQNVTLTLSGGNDAVTASGTPAAGTYLLGQGVDVAFSALFTDLDGDALTYSAQGLPDGMTINASTGRVQGSPTRPGDYTVTVQVADASQTTATQTWQVKVNAPALPPQRPPVDPGSLNPAPAPALAPLLPSGGSSTLGNLAGTPSTPVNLPGTENGIRGFRTVIPTDFLSTLGNNPGTNSGSPFGPATGPNAGPNAGPGGLPPAPTLATLPAASPGIPGLPAGPATPLAATLAAVSAVTPGAANAAAQPAAPAVATPPAPGTAAAPGVTARAVAAAAQRDPITTPNVDRVNLVVGANGQVQVSQTQRAEAGDASGLVVAEVRRTLAGSAGGFEVALSDTRASQVADYSARLPDGQTLPAWARIDPSNGRITATPPPNTEAMSIRVLARDRDGTTRVMEIRLDFKALASAGSAPVAPDAAPAPAPATPPADTPRPGAATPDAGDSLSQQLQMQGLDDELHAHHLRLALQAA